MMKHYFLAVVAAFALAAMAQTQRPLMTQPAQPARAPLQQPSPAQELRTPAQEAITANPSIVNPPRMPSELFPQRDAGTVILNRNPLPEDEPNNEVFKRRDLTRDFPKSDSPAATRIDPAAPKATVIDGKFGVPPSGNTATSPAIPSFAKLAVGHQVQRVAAIETTAHRLPSRAFDTPALANAHLTEITRIRDASMALDKTAHTLAISELWAAQYQMKQAAGQAELVNQRAAFGGKIGADDIAALKKSAASAQAVGDRLAAGQPPFPLRAVNVVVLKDGTDEHAKNLQVYVLPSGPFNNPEMFDVQEIETYLGNFSFAKEASPVSQNIFNFDARVCVGPKLKFREMANLVKRRGLTKCKPLSDPSLALQTIELTFRSPTDITQP